MAKKIKQKKRAPAPRRTSGATRTGSGASASAPGATAEAPTAAATSAATAPAAARRGVQRVDPAARRQSAPSRGRGADAGFEPLDPDDAAIPFDRVPYVPADLRRVALMAAGMVVLIIVANLVISRLTG